MRPGLNLAPAEARDPQKPLSQESGQGKAIVPEAYDALRVGDAARGRSVLPTNQIVSPMGEQVVVPTRLNALAISPDGRWLAGLGSDTVVVVDLEAKQVVAKAAQCGSVAGIVFSPDGRQIFASDASGKVVVYALDAAGKLTKSKSIRPGRQGQKAKAGNPMPAGLAVDPDSEKKTLWAALNIANTVAEIEMASGRVVREIDVGNAPYDVVCAAGKVYVSNWGGRRPRAGDPVGPSGTAPAVRVDPRCNIASEGSVSVVDPAKGQAVKEIVVGPHSSGLAASPDGHFVCVANANADTVSVIDTASDEVVETICTRPAADLLLGSSPNAVAFAPDGRTIYVSNGTNNAIAVVAFDPGKSRLLGCLPAGWYPAGLVFDPRRRTLCVANIKGSGARPADGKADVRINGKTVRGYNTKSKVAGSVSLIQPPAEGELAAATATVLANNRRLVAELARSAPRKDAPPRPIPERQGEPSHFKHVVYIIKENRTYDQILGDMKEGDGNPNLCIFGAEVTPNTHKLAREFVLLDNFFCSGVLSADGHQWTDEAFATDYVEKSFAGWTRSYPHSGGDAMAYAPSGFLWDNALANGKTLRVFGEFVATNVRWKDPARKGKPGFMDCYDDYVRKMHSVEISGTPTIRTLEPYICRSMPGFQTAVTDQYRAEQFLGELRDYERRGEMPNLIVMALPNDHTSGTQPGLPTPEAAVADNDLALGRIVEGISRSRFWRDTCIFVVEDDPQNGFDHVDGHRTVALVVSAYTRRHALDRTNYNQTSMVRSIELVLGLPPMNQLDASATPMASCFTAEPDVSPYTAAKNQIPLDRLNPALSKITDSRQRHWAEVSLRLPLEEVDEADEDTLNRILWHAQRGRNDTYPAWAVADPDEEE